MSITMRDDEHATETTEAMDATDVAEVAEVAEVAATFPTNWQIASDFDPNAHLMNLKGRDYMSVQTRLLWFIRDQRALIVRGLARVPYVIRNEVLELDLERGYAHFRCYVRDVLGNEATMYGSETAKDFGDYAEKAGTKALGRALLTLGYGTSFAPEMDEGTRVVDAPVERRRGNTGANPPRDEPRRGASSAASGRSPIRPAQATPVAAPNASAPSGATDDAATNVTELDQKVASDLQQMDLARKFKASGFDTTAAVEAFVAEHANGRAIDALKLKGGTTAITIGEVRGLIRALAAHNQRRAATSAAAEGE